MTVPNFKIIAMRPYLEQVMIIINSSCHNAKALLKVKKLEKIVPVCPGFTKPLKLITLCKRISIQKDSLLRPVQEQFKVQKKFL